MHIEKKRSIDDQTPKTRERETEREEVSWTEIHDQKQIDYTGKAEVEELMVRKSSVVEIPFFFVIFQPVLIGLQAERERKKYNKNGRLKHLKFNSKGEVKLR